MKQEPKTLGHLADRNRDSMGKYEYQEKAGELAERKRRGRKEISPEAIETKKKWGRPETPDLSLASLTAPQKEKYIMTGVKP